VQSRNKSELLLQNAEAEAIFSLLVGSQVPGGVDINPERPITLEFGIPSDDINLSLGLANAREYSDGDVWNANGSFRRSEQISGSVLISLQDTSGLISLHNIDEVKLHDVLTHLDLEKETSRNLIAKLQDYTDLDATRRFRGAEDFDYKVRGLPPPSHRPLRTYEELHDVMDWEDSLANLELQAFIDFTTLQTNSVLREAFIPAELKSIISEDRANDGDSIEEIFRSTDLPSGKYRIALYTKNARNKYIKRVVEIRITSQAELGPYQRSWIYENPSVGISSIAISPNSDYKLTNVVHTQSLHDQ